MQFLDTNNWRPGHGTLVTCRLVTCAPASDVLEPNHAYPDPNQGFPVPQLLDTSPWLPGTQPWFSLALAMNVMDTQPLITWTPTIGLLSPPLCGVQEINGCGLVNQWLSSRKALFGVQDINGLRR